MKTKMITLFAVFFTIAMGVKAQNTPRVDQRQDNQQARVVQGVKSGELTRAETINLAQTQKKVNRLEKRAKADGKVTPRERKRLNRAQNRSSRQIARKKHNRKDRN